jgi:hypothetical protein
MSESDHNESFVEPARYPTRPAAPTKSVYPSTR